MYRTYAYLQSIVDEAQVEGINTVTMQTRSAVDADLRGGMEDRNRNRNCNLNATMPCQSSNTCNILERSRKSTQEVSQPNPRKRWSYHSISSSSLAENCKTEGLVPLSPNTLQLKQSGPDSRGCRFNQNIRTFHSRNIVGRGAISDCGLISEEYEGRPFLRTDLSSQSLVHFKIRRMHVPHMDNFSKLPDEMVLRVFKWLPKQALGRAAQTCKRLKRLAEDETLWRRVDVQGKFLYPGHLGVLMSRHPWYLRLARAEIRDPTGIPRYSLAPQLRYLDLSMCVVKSETLTALLKMCTSLVKLSLEQLVVPKETLTAMQIFAPTMDAINLTMCEKLDATELTAFLTKAKRLKHLNLGCVVADWSHTDLMNIINSLPETIEQLNLAGFRAILTDSHVDIVAQRCRRLLDLDISDSQEISMASMESISSYLDRLQHLALNRCYGVNYHGYTLLGTMKSLKFLDVHTHIRPETTKDIASLVPGVEINKYVFSAIARPTVGIRRSSIWLERVRD